MSKSQNHKRDFIAEVKAVSERWNKHADGSSPELDRLNEVIKVYLSIEDLEEDSLLKPELHRHLVVSLVAIIQEAVRMTLVEIVDEKELAGEKLPELRNAAMTLEIARELKNQSFSFGQLVGHFYSVSGVDQIDQSLHTVCDTRLSKVLRDNFREPQAEGRPKVTKERLAKETEDSLRKLFQMRNIYCHELGTGITSNEVEMYEFLRASFSSRVPVLR